MAMACFICTWLITRPPLKKFQFTDGPTPKVWLPMSPSPEKLVAAKP